MSESLMDLSTLLCALPATDSSTWGRYIRINAVATVEEGREIFRTHVLRLSETAEIDLPIAIMHNWSTGEGINVDTDDFLPADHLPGRSSCFSQELRPGKNPGDKQPHSGQHPSWPLKHTYAARE